MIFRNIKTMASLVMSTNNLLKIKKNQVQMMKDRGYTIPKSERHLLQPGANTYPEEFNMVYTRGDSNLYVHYIPQDGMDKVNKEAKSIAFPIIAEKINEGINHVIIISNPFRYNYDKEIIDLVNKELVEIEMFSYEFFLVDPTRHRKMPPFKILTPEEKQQELPDKKYSNYPRFQSGDPFVKWFNLKSGDVVRTEEKVSINDQTIPFYRVLL